MMSSKIGPLTSYIGDEDEHEFYSDDQLIDFGELCFVLIAEIIHIKLLFLAVGLHADSNKENDGTLETLDLDETQSSLYHSQQDEPSAPSLQKALKYIDGLINYQSLKENVVNVLLLTRMRNEMFAETNVNSM